MKKHLYEMERSLAKNLADRAIQQTVDSDELRERVGDLDMLKCGIGLYNLNLWIDGIFKGMGRLQDETMQNILSYTANDVHVTHYRVWDNEIFLIAETRKETA